MTIETLLAHPGFVRLEVLPHDPNCRTCAYHGWGALWTLILVPDAGARTRQWHAPTLETLVAWVAEDLAQPPGESAAEADARHVRRIRAAVGAWP